MRIIKIYNKDKRDDDYIIKDNKRLSLDYILYNKEDKEIKDNEIMIDKDDLYKRDYYDNMNTDLLNKIKKITPVPYRKITFLTSLQNKIYYYIIYHGLKQREVCKEINKSVSVVNKSWTKTKIKLQRYLDNKQMFKRDIDIKRYDKSMQV